MRNAVPPLGSIPIAAGGRRAPGVADMGEPAQPKPALEALAQLPRAVELDLAGSNGAFQRKIAHEYARHGPQVGRNIETHLEPRVGGTKVDLLAVADQPPSTLRRRQIGKIELHAGPAGRERVDAAAQQFAQHKRRPALGEDFGALGDRAELTVAFHHPLHRALTSAQNRCVRLAHKSKFWTPAAGSVPHQVRCPAPMLLKPARSARARTSGAILSHSAPDGVFAAPIVIPYRAASEFSPHGTDLRLDSGGVESHECRASRRMPP